MTFRRVTAALVVATLGSPAACTSFGIPSSQDDGGPTDASPADASSSDVADGGDDDPVPISCFAIAFDGAGDHIDVADSADLDPTGPSTVEAWVYLEDEKRGEQHIVSHHDHDGRAGYLLMLFGTSGQDGGAATLGASARYYDGTNSKQVGFGAGTRVMARAWTHVATTNDGKGTLRTWVNGEPLAEQTASASPANADYGGVLRIGGAAYTNGFWFGGMIDEVRISKVARYGTAQFTPERRWRHDADTIALFHFDEGTGDEANDARRKHAGQLYGAAWKPAPCR